MRGYLVDSLAFKDLINNSKVIGTFYTSPTFFETINWAWPGSIAYFVMFILGVLRIRNLKKRIQILTESQIKAPPEFSKEFIDFLLNHPRNICSTLDLNEILHVDDRSIESQRQSRSKFINSINMYFWAEYGIDTAIERLSSTYDK